MWLRRSAHFIEKFSYPTSRIVNIVGAIVLAIMMFLVAADVTLRYIFNSPIRGSVELVELMMIVVVFLAVAYTASQKGHVSIELVVSRFPQRVQAILDVFTSLLSLGFIVLVIWRSIVRGHTMWADHHVTIVLSIPIFPFLYIIAFGCALLVIVLFANILESLARAVNK